MKVYNFFKFISEKKPDYPITTWGPRAMRGTIKHLKPIEGQGNLDLNNGVVSGWFEYSTPGVSNKAYFNENGELEQSFTEVNLRTTYGEDYLFEIFKPQNIRRDVTPSYYESFLAHTIEILAGAKKIKLERYVDVPSNISVDGIGIEGRPTNLMKLIRNQISLHLTDEESDLIKNNHYVDLSGKVDDSDLMMVVGYTQSDEQDFPEWMIELRNYILECLVSCAQSEADSINNGWFTGIGPKSFDGENNIESLDFSNWPIVKLNLSGNLLKPYYHFDKDLTLPHDMMEPGRRNGNWVNGVPDYMINEYLENYPYNG